MFHKVRRTCWKYVNELKQNLSERTLRSVPEPSSKEDTDVLANKVHFVIFKSYEAACPMQNSFHMKDNIWWNSELASLRKEARHQALRKAIKIKQNKIGRVKSSPYPTSKKLSDKQSAIHGIAL